MKITPVYTLCINEDEYINERSEIKIKMKNGAEHKGIFLNCDNVGLEVETGEEDSNVLFLLYRTIESIEEV